MGASGYKPDEDDDYHDLLAATTNPIEKVLSRKTTPLSIYRYGQQWRAAAEFLTVMAPLYSHAERKKWLDLALAKLDDLIKSDDWIAQWNDPEIAKRTIIRERDAFAMKRKALLRKA